MTPRFHLHDHPFTLGETLMLPEAVSRHIQVLRMQPGGVVHLFNGEGQEWLARVTEMGRKVVTVSLESLVLNDRELGAHVTLAIGMPANDRMDFVVEKATELGVSAIQPLVCERSVLRIDGERAAKKVAHWQGVASAAAEQCGRAVVPRIASVQTLSAWLRSEDASGSTARRGVLSLRDAQALPMWVDQTTEAEAGDNTAMPAFVFLNGPEGGLSDAEEHAARLAGWQAVSLGKRVLRADTAPLTALTLIGARFERWDRR